jgi:hypothetical protein
MIAHQWCGFRGGHSGNKPASTVVPMAMVSYGMIHSQGLIPKRILDTSALEF